MIAAAFTMIFYPALIAGLSLGLLIGALALGALSSTGGVSLVMSESAPMGTDRLGVDGSAARVELVEHEAVPAPDKPEQAVSSTVQASARATSHADDDPAGSEAAMAPQPSVLTTHGLAVTPPVSSVLTVTRSRVEQMSRSAAIRHGLDPDWYAGVIFCESSFRANARGAAREIGAAQFKGATFDWFSRLSGLGYAPSDIHDPYRNIDLAAWGMANGYAGHWTCAK